MRSVLHQHQTLVFAKNRSSSTTTTVLINISFLGPLNVLIQHADYNFSNTPSEEPDWLRVISELPGDGADLYTRTENVIVVDTH